LTASFADRILLSVGLACLRVIRLKIEILLLSYYHRTAIAFTNVTTPDKQCKNHNRMHLSACGYVMSFRKPETLVRGVCPPEFSDTYGCCCSAFFLFGRSPSPVVERLGCAVRAGRGTVGRHVERWAAYGTSCVSACSVAPSRAVPEISPHGFCAIFSYCAQCACRTRTRIHSTSHLSPRVGTCHHYGSLLAPASLLNFDSTYYGNLKHDTFHSVSRRLNDSSVWCDLLKVKEIYLMGREVCTKNGNLTRFWKDRWLYQQPLCITDPELFELCECKEATVDKIRCWEVIISFRRWLPRDLRDRWEQIWEDVLSFPLDNDPDVILWSLEKNNKFLVKSTYNALTSSDGGLYNKRIWKGKVPAKIKIFMWLMTKDAILTKDNLIKRKWKGDPVSREYLSSLFSVLCCESCLGSDSESFGANAIPRNLDQCWNWCEKWLPFGKKFHVCGVAAICWAIWKARNRACFDKVIIKSPRDIIYHGCALMKYWAGLFSKADKEQLEEGLNTMLEIADKILKRQKDMDTARQLQDGDPDGQGNAPA